MRFCIQVFYNINQGFIRQIQVFQWSCRIDVKTEFPHKFPGFFHRAFVCDQRKNADLMIDNNVGSDREIIQKRGMLRHDFYTVFAGDVRSQSSKGFAVQTDDSGIRSGKTADNMG